jgi:hypothetical protein
LLSQALQQSKVSADQHGAVRTSILCDAFAAEGDRNFVMKLYDVPVAAVDAEGMRGGAAFKAPFNFSGKGQFGQVTLCSAARLVGHRCTDTLPTSPVN